MAVSLRTLLRFLLVVPVVFGVYAASVAAYSVIDTSLAPSGTSSRAVIVLVGALAAFAAVLVGCAVAPSHRLLVGAAIVVTTSAAQLIQLPKPGSIARTLLFWALTVHVVAGLAGLFVVAQHIRRRGKAAFPPARPAQVPGGA